MDALGVVMLVALGFTVVGTLMMVLGVIILRRPR